MTSMSPANSRTRTKIMRPRIHQLKPQPEHVVVRWVGVLGRVLLPGLGDQPLAARGCRVLDAPGEERALTAPAAVRGQGGAYAEPGNIVLHEQGRRRHGQVAIV